MNWRRLLFIPPILIGVGVFHLLTTKDGTDTGAARPEAALPVRVVEIGSAPFTATVAGYGRVRAERTWSAIAQVNGRVVDLAPGLAVGKVLSAETALIRTDPRDYEIARAKAAATLAGAEAELAEIDVEESNTNSSLGLEREVRDLLQTDYERQITLAKKGTVARRTADDANRALLAQRKVVTNLENTLRRYPAQRITLSAAIDRSRADLEQAERDLENTGIAAPFTGRIVEESVEIGQYVRTGDTLLKLEAVDASEIVAEFQPQALGGMIRSLIPGETLAPTLNLDGNDGPLTLFAHYGVSAEVRIERHGRGFAWPAEIVRFTGSADSDTGALGIVVRVKDAQRPNPENRRPPLTNGTFVQVVLQAQAPSGVLIPRDALHSDENGAAFVYVMDADNRLQRRAVRRGPVVGARMLIRDGLDRGDTLVLSSPQPPVIGMLLEPVRGDG